VSDLSEVWEVSDERGRVVKVGLGSIREEVRRSGGSGAGGG